MKLGMVSRHGTNMLWYFFGRIGTSFGVSFLQTGDSLKKPCGSERERVTFVCKTIYAASPNFLYRGNIELYECRAKFWNYSGFFWPFYTLIEFLVI